MASLMNVVFVVQFQHAPYDGMVGVTVTYFCYLGMERCGYKWLVSNLFAVHPTIMQIFVESLISDLTSVLLRDYT